MRKINPITIRRNQEIKERAKSGLKAKELAVLYNLTIGRICQILGQK